MANVATVSFMNYGFETSFGAVSTGLTNVFGAGQKMISMNRKNNLEKVFGMGNRDAQKLIPKKYEGAVSVEFVLANPWFFKGVMGTVSSTSSAPRTHTFSKANTIPSLTIENEIEIDTVSRFRLLGCQVSTMTLTATVNELVKIKLDMVYSTETLVSTTTDAATESFVLFTFAQGTLELPDDSTLADVQNVEIVYVNNPEPVFGLGSRFSQNGPVKNTDIQITATLAYEASATLIQKLYGAAGNPNATITETADMVLTFTNGLSDNNERSIELTVTGIVLDEHNLPQDPTALIVEDATLFGRGMAVVAKNATTTAV